MRLGKRPCRSGVRRYGRWWRSKIPLAANHRDWTDPRDGRHCVLWLEQGRNRRVLGFASEQDGFEVEVHSDTPLPEMTDAQLVALLDRGRG